jgi:HEPN domain-containing protein
MSTERFKELEKLEKLARLVYEELSQISKTSSDYVYLKHYTATKIKFENLMNVASQILPEHKALFLLTYEEADSITDGLKIWDARSITLHLLNIIQIEKSSETKIEEMKIFESAEEKLKQANLSFQRGDYTSVLNNLNTALELVLKDKLGIPTTITKINTAKIIDILVKHKIGPYPYFNEAKKHILEIDNKVKHQGYKPSKIDCINAIKAMEELLSKLKSMKIEISEEIKNKIYEEL